MSIMGIDPGLSSTGLAIIGQKNGDAISLLTIETAKREPMIERILAIVNSINGEIVNNPIEFAVIEMPFNTKGHGKKNIELVGVIKYQLFMIGIPFLEIGQSTLKKFAVGKGKAEKGELMLRLFKEFGIEAKNNDESDACWLAILGKGFCIGSELKWRQEIIDKLRAKEKALNGVT